MDEHDDLLEEMRRKALETAAEHSREMGEEDVDVLESLREGGETGPAASPDATLGGYIATHDRPPAFEGADGQPYTVGLDVEDLGEPGEKRFAAFFVFIRWAATGAGIMEHVESGDVARGETADAATAAALDLSLFEVKTELDAAIERRRAELEE